MEHLNVDNKNCLIWGQAAYWYKALFRLMYKIIKISINIKLQFKKKYNYMVKKSM